jgi:hypothetical protein
MPWPSWCAVRAHPGTACLRSALAHEVDLGDDSYLDALDNPPQCRGRSADDTDACVHVERAAGPRRVAGQRVAGSAGRSGR